MYYQANKSSLYQYIDELRQRWGISYSSYPINTISLCNKCEDIIVEQHPFNTNGLCGIAMLGDKVDTIIVNRNRSPREQNFDCGHEILHISKHRNSGEDCFRCFTSPKPEQDLTIEWEANEGSAELTVPYKLFLPKIKAAFKNLRTRVDLKCLQTDLALTFDVSMAVIYYRFENLKCEIAQYNDGIPLRQIALISHAEQARRGLRILSLNDIFGRAS